MKQSLLFIYNPNAGKGMIKKYLSDILDIFCRGDFFVSIYVTEKSGDATQCVADRGADFDYLVCSGGDGTMNEVATGLMRIPEDERPVIGYIPAGTVNDFAGTLRIPKIMTQAAELVVRGEKFRCDLGKFNNRYFTYVVGFGAFTEVSYRTPQDLKNTFGKTAYFMEALKYISEIQPHRMKIVTDTGVYEDEFILGLISNSESVSGFMAYSLKDIKVDDGLFEGLFIRNIRNPLELQAVLNAFINRTLDSDHILNIISSKIHIISEDYVQWTVDGEDGGLLDEVDIENQYHAMTMMVDYGEMNGVSSKAEWTVPKNA